MSFLKIDDPAKRDFLVKEFLRLQKDIKQDFLSEKLGDQSQQREFKKEYRPLLEAQSKIASELGSIKESATTTATALKALPASISSLKAIQFPQYPSIEAYEDDPVSDVRTLEIGGIASEYLHKFASSKKTTDTTFGIKSEGGVFYIGDSPITIQLDDITVRDKTYKGTPGLWELLTMSRPNETIFNDSDRADYAEILHATNAIRSSTNPNKPKASRSWKYTNIIKPIWNAKTGKGVDAVFLPRDPNALLEMLALRLASFKAGNTGLRNEIVSICDELLRQNVIDAQQYKTLIV